MVYEYHGLKTWPDFFPIVVFMNFLFKIPMTENHTLKFQNGGHYYDWKPGGHY